MNLFIHGLDGRIELGNSYFNDLLANVKADYLIANPPFNDGSKGEDGWGADRVPAKDPRLQLGEFRATLSPRNANTMWMLHFLYHLKDTGSAGFVMAMGESSTSETARREVRQALVDADYVDCIVRLSGQLFANTQIPCALWFLSKNRDGTGGFRKRTSEIMFIDGSKLGTLIPGSRKQKELTAGEIETMASVYRNFKRTETPEAVPGFCRAVPVEEVRTHGYALTPGRYVGSPDADEDEESFEERMPRLIAELELQFEKSHALEAAILQHAACLRNVR
jgi:type I restriction enzyme M protein